MKLFVKWAGGKGGLIEQLKYYYPYDLGLKKIEKYVEPFVGGGAVLIDILQKYDIEKAYAFDTNEDLITSYNVIKNNVEELIEKLNIMEKDFLKLDMKSRPKYFYEVRDKYNFENLDSITRSSLFIFLNKTCFNGPYRVNKKGYYNVPCGKYKNPCICNSNNLRNLANLLKNVIFQVGDYSESMSIVDDKTFVYFDPPYRPLVGNNGFTSYTKECFGEENQIELASFFRKLNLSGAKLMLSNSNPKCVNIDDDFFDINYKGFNINEVFAKRAINSNVKARGKISELVITNYVLESNWDLSFNT